MSNRDIRLTLSKNIDTETIKNLNRFSGSIITKSTRTRFLATSTENELRELFSSNSLWYLVPAYPLEISGGLDWLLAEPIYPDNYDFILSFSATTPYDKRIEAIGILLKNKYVESIRNY